MQEFSDLRIRCSSIHRIMGKSKTGAGITEKQAIELDSLINKKKARTKRQEEKMLALIAKRDLKPEFDLSEGAKTFIKSIVKQRCYNYKLDFDSKQTAKGDIVEDDNIRLYNKVFFTNYKKNEKRIFGEFIEGECDIDAIEQDMIVDIKSSYTKETFPATEEDISVGGYEWQGRGYMKLYIRSKFRLAYCLTSTPYELLQYEKNLSLHIIEENALELPYSFRVTTKDFVRCKKKEDLIEYKVKECRKYANWYYNQILNKH